MLELGVLDALVGDLQQELRFLCMMDPRGWRESGGQGVTWPRDKEQDVASSL